MTDTERITHSICNRMFSAAETLGYLAAVCDVQACYRNITDGERRSLERRAAAYRELQLEELKNGGKA